MEPPIRFLRTENWANLVGSVEGILPDSRLYDASNSCRAELEGNWGSCYRIRQEPHPTQPGVVSGVMLHTYHVLLDRQCATYGTRELVSREL